MLVQPVYLLVHTPADILQGVLWSTDISLVIGNRVHEVHYPELVVPAHTIHPYVPHEQRPHYLAVLLHECLQVQDLAIVQCGTCTCTMQSLGIALIVLYGIYIGMQHIFAIAYFLAQWSFALHKPVIVGIHAGYHIRTQIIHKGSLLALAQCGTGRQHDLETDVIRLVFVQDIAPESYVIVTLHICHYALLGATGLELVGSRNVVGRYVANQSSSHVLTFSLHTTMSSTSVTQSVHPSIITAGECVVRIICALGFRSRISPISLCCHSTCREISGSSMNKV